MAFNYETIDEIKINGEELEEFRPIENFQVSQTKDISHRGKDLEA